MNYYTLIISPLNKRTTERQATSHGAMFFLCTLPRARFVSPAMGVSAQRGVKLHIWFIWNRRTNWLSQISFVVTDFFPLRGIDSMT